MKTTFSKLAMVIAVLVSAHSVKVAAELSLPCSLGIIGAALFCFVAAVAWTWLLTWACSDSWPLDIGLINTNNRSYLAVGVMAWLLTMSWGLLWAGSIAGAVVHSPVTAGNLTNLLFELAAGGAIFGISLAPLVKERFGKKPR